MKKLFSKMDKPLLVTTIIFFVFGLIMIQSASSMESFMRYDTSPYHYFFRQLLFFIVGCFLFLLAIIWPTKNYNKMEKLLLLLSITSLLAVYIIGSSAKGAQRWFDIGIIRIHPSEFVKVAMIIYMAAYYEKNKNKLSDTSILLTPLTYVIIIFGLIFIQPDLGTSVIFGVICFLMFYAVPMKKKDRKNINKIVFGAIMIVIAIFIVTGGDFLKGYQRERLDFINPCGRYTEKSGYQLCNSFIAFYGGGLTGKGIGASTQKYLYLPEAYTDFIFPIIVEEWGLIVGIIILIGYLFVIYRVYKIAKRATNTRNSLIAYGVCIYFFLHVAVNLLGVMGLMPLTGIPLLFLSYGGSYLWSVMIALGLVQRIEIENRNSKELKNKREIR